MFAFRGHGPTFSAHIASPPPPSRTPAGSRASSQYALIAPRTTSAHGPLAWAAPRTRTHRSIPAPPTPLSKGIKDRHCQFLYASAPIPSTFVELNGLKLIRSFWEIKMTSPRLDTGKEAPSVFANSMRACGFDLELNPSAGCGEAFRGD